MHCLVAILLTRELNGIEQRSEKVEIKNTNKDGRMFISFEESKLPLILCCLF